MRGAEETGANGKLRRKGNCTYLREELSSASLRVQGGGRGCNIWKK